MTCFCGRLVKKEGSEVSNGSSVSAAAGTGWSVACTTVEEWNEVIDSLRGSKHVETKRLIRALQGMHRVENGVNVELMNMGIK